MISRSLLLSFLLTLPGHAVIFGTEDFAYGNGNLEFGCEISGTGTRYYSGIPADGATRTIITVLDFDRDFIGLWVDPDHNDFHTAATGANSCDAGGTYTDGSWSTAVRLASGAACQWGNLIIATSWSDFHGQERDRQLRADLPVELHPE